jgi:TonB family protein
VTVIGFGNDNTPDIGPSSFTTERQAAAHRSGRKRMIWAGVVALVGLILLVLLGPDEQAIKERFEYYGAPGELNIMPEISIDDGSQKVHQIPRSLQVQPPPSNIEIEKEDPTEEGTMEVPPEVLSDPNEVETVREFPQVNPEFSSDSQVELARPMQTNPDYFILNLVRPQYPLDASEAERRIPLIIVTVAIHVGPDGLVSDAWITQNTGGPLFGEECLKAVRQWKFGWRIDPGVGRQFPITWRFKSPYFNPDSQAR